MYPRQQAVFILAFFSPNNFGLNESMSLRSSKGLEKTINLSPFQINISPACPVENTDIEMISTTNMFMILFIICLLVYVSLTMDTGRYYESVNVSRSYQWGYFFFVLSKYMTRLILRMILL